METYAFSIQSIGLVDNFKNMVNTFTIALSVVIVLYIYDDYFGLWFEN